jgi:osmotically-inducible protein OsmY
MKRKTLLAAFAGAALALATACGGGENNNNDNATVNRATNANANANANANVNANANANARNWNMTHEEYNKNENSYRAEAKGRGETIGQDVEDGWIHFKVRGALATASGVPSTGISVDVEKKVVTLRGTVATKEEKEKAEKAAHVEGATKVVDKLEVKPEGNTNKNANANAHAASNANKKG